MGMLVHTELKYSPNQRLNWRSVNQGGMPCAGRTSGRDINCRSRYVGEGGIKRHETTGLMEERCNKGKGKKGEGKNAVCVCVCKGQLRKWHKTWRVQRRGVVQSTNKGVCTQGTRCVCWGSVAKVKVSNAGVCSV